MRRIFSLLGLVIAVAIGTYIYSQHAKNLAPSGNLRADIDATGVRNDLLGLANAERRYFAREGKYVSLEDLIASGEVDKARTRRGPYTYSIDFTDTSFVITATCSGDPPPGLPRTFSVDQNMQLRSE